MICEDFLSQLDDPALQEGRAWPPELREHAETCPHCNEILTIFDAISMEVKTLPRPSTGDGAEDAVLLSVHDGIEQDSGVYRLWRAMTMAAATALAALLTVFLPSMLAS